MPGSHGVGTGGLWGGSLNFPSPSVFGQMAPDQLNEEGTGLGFINHMDRGNYPTFFTTNGGTGALDYSAALLIPHSELLTTGTTSGNTVAICGQPTTAMKFASGIHLAMEVGFQIPTATQTARFFVGFVDPTAIASTASAATAIATGTTTVTTVSGKSLVGFATGSSNPTWVNAVYRNGSPTSSPNTLNQVVGTLTPTALTNALTASGLFPPGIPGYGGGQDTVLTPNASPGNLTTGTAVYPPGVGTTNYVVGSYVKLGVSFDGMNRVIWYVNGYAIAITLLDSSFDQTTLMAPVFSLTTGASSAATADVDFFACAEHAFTGVGS